MLYDIVEEELIVWEIDFFYVFCGFIGIEFSLLYDDN